MPDVDLACCYHPTTIMLIDDNLNYVESLKLRFDSKEILFKTYTDPLVALDFLKKEYSFHPYIEECLSYYSNLELDDDYLHTLVDLDTLYQEVFNPRRFEEISVIVVDQSMPQLDGIDLCQKLKDRNFKIIMLTGEATEEIAIQALNEKLIDLFLRKSEMVERNLLFQSIEALKKRYFYDRSLAILNNITTYKGKDFCLNDPVFKKFFHALCEKHRLVEYYMLDTKGNFLMLDRNGICYSLIMQTEADMLHAHNLLTSHDVTSSIVDEISQRKKLLYLRPNEIWPESTEELEQHLYDAEILEGSDRYYYAFIQENNNNHFLKKLKQQKILSFNEYRGVKN